ncbi:Fc.00g077560.m01.CDS01 [Cosmosporella sp. VM-42]
MDPSFTDEEKRFVLAEVIKTSHLDVLALADFIKAHDIEPAWFQMQLPLGRNLNQCLQVAQYMGIPPSSHKRKSSNDHSEQSTKRSAFPEQREPSTASAALSPTPSAAAAQRALLPRPVPPNGVNDLTSQPQTQPPTPPQQPRKRGRPSRMERAKKLRPPVLPQIAPRPEQGLAPTAPQPTQPTAPYTSSSGALEPTTSYSTSSGQAEPRRNVQTGRFQRDDGDPPVVDRPRQTAPELSHISTPRVMPEGTPGHFETGRSFTTPNLAPLEPEPRARASSRGSQEPFPATLPPLLERQTQLAPMDSSYGDNNTPPLANPA